MCLAIDGEDACAVEHLHHGVAGGAMRAEAFALGEGKDSQIEILVLCERAADDLAVLIVDQRTEVNGFGLRHVLYERRLWNVER